MKNIKATTPFKWTYYATKKQLPIIIVLVVFNSLLACTGTVGAIVSKYLIDNAVNKNIRMFFIFAVILASIFIFNTVFKALTNYLTERSRALIEQNIKADLFRQITLKNYEDISSFHSGTLLNRLTSDVTLISNCVTTVLPTTVSVIVKLICAFVVITMFEPWFSVLFLMQ